jgi:hypothetical protein
VQHDRIAGFQFARHFVKSFHIRDRDAIDALNQIALVERVAAGRRFYVGNKARRIDVLNEQTFLSFESGRSRERGRQFG